MTRPVESWEDKGIFEVSSAEPDAIPVWVDLTSRIRDMVSPIEVSIGRQNDLDQSEPSRLTLVLENADDALTYGNTTSPYAAWWGPGRRCRYRETIAGTTLTLFTGFLEVPEELVVTAGIEARVAISAVDRLARLEHTLLFVSTLTEHIRYTGGTALKAFWPLNDVAGATTGGSLVAGIGPLIQVVSYDDIPHFDQLQWGQRTGPIGDDAAYVQMAPTDAVIAASYNGSPRLARRDFTVTLNAGEVVAILGWIYIPVDPAKPLGPGQVLVAHANSFLPPTFQLSAAIGTGWTFHVDTATGGSADLVVPAVKTDAWSAFGMFLDVTTAAVTLCVDGQVATGTLSLALPSSGSLQEIALDGLTGQSFGLIQIYAGHPGTINRAFFLAQYQMGLAGLERQSTGDRIRTLAQYAGLPTSEIANTIDPGSSVMQRALLAGKDPLTAMREAEVTEQGLLHTDGDGNLVFQDRRRLYNI